MPRAKTARVTLRLTPSELMLLQRAEQATRSRSTYRGTAISRDRRWGSLGAYVRIAALEQAARDLMAAALHTALSSGSDLERAIAAGRADLLLESGE